MAIGYDRYDPSAERTFPFSVNFNGCQYSESPQLDFDLPNNANMMQVRVHTSSRIRVRKVEIRKFDMWLTYVEKKTVMDGRGNSSEYSYTYEYPAVNDAVAGYDGRIHSDIIKHRQDIGDCPGACGDLRHQPFTEFRGFGIVTAFEPTQGGGGTSRSTEYRFRQDDIFKGQLESATMRGTGSGNLLLKTINTLGSVNTVTRNNSTGDQSNFVFTGEQSSETYDGDNTNPKIKRVVSIFDSGNGNLKETHEYESPGTNLYRRTTFTYNKKVDDPNFPNTYLVNLLNKTSVYDAKQTASTSDDVLSSFIENDWDQTNWSGNLLSVTVNDGTQTFTGATFDYDSYGNRLHSTDALGRVITTTYDAIYHAFPVSMTNAKGHSVTTTYDYRFGLPQNVTDPNNGISRLEYDLFGRKWKVWNALDYGHSPTQIVTYNLVNQTNPNIQIETRTDAGGTGTAAYALGWTFYDGLGCVIQSQKRAAAANTIILVDQDYTARDTIFRVTNPYTLSGNGGNFRAQTWTQPLTEHNYDVMNRENKIVYPDSAVQKTDYDHWTTIITNTNGIRSEYRNDTFGRMNRVKEFNLGAEYTTFYGYDVLNRLTIVTDTLNITTTMTYDWLGRKKTMRDPDMGVWTYDYDIVGNLKRQTDAKNKSLCFTYDPLNRVETKTARDGATCTANALYSVSYEYDLGFNALGQTQKGFRTGMSDPSGSTSWQFDRLGRVLKESKSINGAPANPYQTQYTYNDLNQVVSNQYPDGEVVTTSYNPQNLPQSLSGTSGYITSAGYNASDQILNLAFASGTTTVYGYDPNNLRLTSLVTSGNLQNFAYEYDSVGNIKKITDASFAPARISNFTYDDLNRLTRWELAAIYDQEFKYTPTGNLIERKDVGTPQMFWYSDTLHTHAVTHHNGIAQFVYDANGNMIQRYDTLQNFDAENRLTSVSNASATTTYAYDGDGTRVKRTANGVTTYYIGNHYEVTVSGTTSVLKYYYFGAQRIALRNSSGVVYLHSDHLGSTSVTSGVASSKQTYYPFGANFTTIGTPPADFGFTGQQRTSLHQFDTPFEWAILASTRGDVAKWLRQGSAKA